MTATEQGAKTEIAVVAPFVAWAVGTVFAPDAIPLHVTVLSNYLVDTRRLTEVLDRIRRVATSTAPLVARGGATQLFGPLGNIKVTELTDADQFFAMHQRLSAAVGDLGQSVEPSYHGAGFRPHVTEAEGSRLAQDGRALLQSFAVVDCTLVDRVVVASYPAHAAGSAMTTA